MTLKEIMLAENQMDKKIYTIIQEFEKSSGFQVDCIQLNRIDVTTWPNPPGTDIRRVGATTEIRL